MFLCPILHLAIFQAATTRIEAMIFLNQLPALKMHMFRGLHWLHGLEGSRAKKPFFKSDKLKSDKIGM